MRKIVSIKFGSHLYGTSTPSSDIDIKSVHVPDARDIVLQRVQETISDKREKGFGEKNLPGELDDESVSLQRFLDLASAGKTVALDMLFAPEWAMLEPPEVEWNVIVANRRRLLTREAGSFINYCRQQANKYGIKGSRMAAARLALRTVSDLLERNLPSSRLAQFGEEIERATCGVEHLSIVDIPNSANGETQRHWEVCGRKLPYAASIKNVHDILGHLVDEYGKRALQAETEQGINWKALSHAVRIGTQALELLSTGHITFPVPNAEHILAIKTGRLPYRMVATEIENLLVRVETASTVSSLSEKADREWIDDFVFRTYANEVASLSNAPGRILTPGG